METPGHTKGTISFFFNTPENKKTYCVRMFGGVGANTMVRARYDFEAVEKRIEIHYIGLRKKK